MLERAGFQISDKKIEGLSQLESRTKDIKEGMILADLEIDVLERWSPLLKKWSERFILMGPLISNDLTLRLKRVGIRHILEEARRAAIIE